MCITCLGNIKFLCLGNLWSVRVYTCVCAHVLGVAGDDMKDLEDTNHKTLKMV